MAPKKQLSRQPTNEKVEEKRPKPSSSSDDDNDNEEEDDEVEEQSQEQSETDGDASSEEQEQQQKQKEHLVKTPVPKFANGSDSGSGSESEDDNPSAYKVQSIMPKPASAKRAHQETDDSTNTSKKVKTTEAKKKEKKATLATSGTPGAGCITRLWSDEDEIAVLKGMVEFKEQKGMEPSADMALLHGFVKGKLKVDFSKDQLKSKIARLKKRFAKASKRGEEAVFSSRHESLVFELAKRIWGARAGNLSKSGVGKVSKSGGGETNDEDAKKKKDVVVWKEGDGEEFWSSYPFLRASFDNVGGSYPSLVKNDLVKEKLSFIGSDRAKELDDRWRKLFWEEAQLNCKMLGLMKEQVEMALNR